MNSATIERKPGIRTHVLLVFAMASVITIVTGLCLLLIRQRLRAQVTDDLSQNLSHSVLTFQNLQAERVGALNRENSLLAELPTLKALMTSGDDLTIQDGAIEFWQLSGNDLFALANSSGRIVSIYTRKTQLPDVALQDGIKNLLAHPDKHYLLDGTGLYVCSLRPLYFGNDETGTLLGYVISGVSIERTVRQISQPTGVEATFLSAGKVVASTLPPAGESALIAQAWVTGTPKQPTPVKIGTTRYLAATEDLSPFATSPLQLALLTSFGPAEASISRINRVIVSAGLLALLSGTVLMIVLSRLVTRPLEELSASVVAFGVGDDQHRVPRYGTQEVRQLSSAFDSMRVEILQTNQALVESERLATIGRMASSVSHDLRHYLAAIYANSEFLASHRLSEAERAEIFADIRTAVHGTTEMIESLLIFSRTGSSLRRSHELMATLVERAVALVRSHPDAEGITISSHCCSPDATPVVADGKQIERAVCNLLLNACQATRGNGIQPEIIVDVVTQAGQVVTSVTDNGDGVPESISTSLFDPFVSEGKQKGTGLGLTLSSCIAAEHGGEVTLLRSRPGETIFRLRLPLEVQSDDTNSAQTGDPRKVITHENART